MEDCEDHKSDCYHTNNRIFMWRFNKEKRKTMTTTTPIVTHPSNWLEMPTVTLQMAWDTHSQGNIAIKKLCLSIAEKTKKKLLLTTREKRLYEFSCSRLLNISNQLERQKMSVSSNPNWIISADNFQSIHHYVEETEKVLSKGHGIQLTQTDKEILRQQFDYRW